MLRANQFNRVCRTCLTHEMSDDSCTSLYKVIDLKNGDSREIAKMIENCINIQITSTDDLPQIVCVSCATLIQNFYVFRNKCHKNDTYLREQVHAWKVKHEIKTEDTESNLFEVDIRSVEEVQINELQDTESTVSEKLDQDHLDNSNECNIFEDFPDDRVDDESSSDSGADELNESGFAVETLEEPLKPIKGSHVPVQDENTDEEANTSVQQITLHQHQCDICFEMFESRKELLFHRRANHINEISEEYYTTIKKDNKTHYICKICKHFCKHKDILRVHLRSHTGEKPYKCVICPQSFAQKAGVRKHMKTHNLERIEKKPKIEFKCGSCKEAFESEGAVKFHYAVVHPDEQDKVRTKSKPVEKLCDICGKLIKDLLEHFRWHAGQQKKEFECKLCGKVLSTSSSLSKHLRRHSDERKFVCDTCGKKFKTKQDLTLHRKIHSDERNHECQLCGRKFLHNNRLRIHLKVHAGEKPYRIYDNRKKEKKRLRRLEMLKNNPNQVEPKPRKRKDKRAPAGQMEDDYPPPVQISFDIPPVLQPQRNEI